MRRRTFYYSILVLFSLTANAQVPTIINEIGELESVRDPKCYATASRLEDFIYGTPLESETRFEKIALQKAFIRAQWQKASAAATAAGKTEIDAATLRPVLQSAVPYLQAADGSWMVRDTPVTARDKRQYGSIAYALRAILAVQQDALVDPSAKLLPLNAEAVELFKESIDLTTLAALQRADRESRKLNHDRMQPQVLAAAWKGVVPVWATTVASKGINPVQHSELAPIPPNPIQRSEAVSEKFGTIKAIIAEKISAFEAYNNISMPVFLRNLQVYMARHMWPADPEEGKAFRDSFTEVMVAWMSDTMLEAEKHAKKAGHPLIRVEDVHAALQVYQPHEANQYEDIIYFPRLPKDERVVIEAYDLDSFRDPGMHWVYLREAINDPKYKGTIEPDPFAAELLTEGAAQEGVLILRLAGMVAAEEGKDRLELAHLKKSLERVQAKLDKHASMPPVKKRAAAIASAPAVPKKSNGKSGGKFFTDITNESGVQFEHRFSDWLARFIRGYTVVEGNQVRLAVPPTFGGAAACLSSRVWMRSRALVRCAVSSRSFPSSAAMKPATRSTSTPICAAPSVSSSAAKGSGSMVPLYFGSLIASLR